MKKISLLLLLSIILQISLISCKKTNEQERCVRIAIQPSAAFIPLYIARYKGFIEDALAPKKVSVQWQDFESGPPINESLFADMSDIGVIGDVPTVIALANSTPMKLVGIPARGPDAYAVLTQKSNGSFNSAKELKGKRIATVFGSTGHNFTTLLLKKYGLTFDDIEFLNISASEAENTLISGLADAFVIWEPNITRLTEKGVAKVIARGSETSLKGTNGFIAREEFLSENADIIKTILKEYIRAAELIPDLDSKTKERVAAQLNLSEGQLDSIASIYDYNINISTDDIDSLQDTIRFLVDIGNLSKPYNIETKIERMKL